MKVIRFHNKKKYMFSKENIIISIMSLIFLILINTNENLTQHLKDNDFYFVYNISLLFIIVLIFSLPFLIYKNEFESYCHIDEDGNIIFKDEFNMFNKKIKKEEIVSIENINEIFLIKMKNNKSYTFKIKENIEENINKINKMLNR